MIKIFIISPLFLVCTVNYRSSFSSLIKPEYELYIQLIRCASFTAWYREHCYGCPRAKNTLNSSLSCGQACLTYCLPKATSCSSLLRIWLEDDSLGPLLIGQVNFKVTCPARKSTPVPDYRMGRLASPGRLWWSKNSKLEIFHIFIFSTVG